MTSSDASQAVPSKDRPMYVAWISLAANGVFPASIVVMGLIWGNQIPFCTKKGCPISMDCLDSSGENVKNGINLLLLSFALSLMVKVFHIAVHDNPDKEFSNLSINSSRNTFVAIVAAISLTLFVCSVIPLFLMINEEYSPLFSLLAPYMRFVSFALFSFFVWFCLEQWISKVPSIVWKLFGVAVVLGTILFSFWFIYMSGQ